MTLGGQKVAMWSKLHRALQRSSVRFSEGGSTLSAIPRGQSAHACAPPGDPLSALWKRKEEEGGEWTTVVGRLARGCHTSTAQHKAPEDERSGENGSETGQRSIRACRLCNSCPELRLESCKASRTARGMTETWTDAAMDWPRQPRLRNHGPKYRNLDRSLSRRGLTSCATARKQMREGVGLSVERPPSFCAAGRTALSAQASRTKGWCSGPGG